MDFNDTPEEAAFRAEARAWLEANAEPLAPGETNSSSSERTTPEDVKKSQAEEEGGRRLGLHHLAQGIWWSRRDAHAERDLE
jgi:hypothetical protein